MTEVPGVSREVPCSTLKGDTVLDTLDATWKASSQHAGEKRGVAGLLLGRTERAARAAELQLCAPGAIAQSPGREAALAWASLAQRFPASSVLARQK